MQLFYSQLNALLVKDAEEYYRMSMAGGNVTWNIRDKVSSSCCQHTGTAPSRCSSSAFLILCCVRLLHASTW